jgi:uroporphyrinogen-III synthase
MSPRPVATVVLFSAPGTLEGIDGPLHRAGVRLVRIISLDFRPMDPSRWLTRLESLPVPRSVIVTSRTAVTAGVVPWLTRTKRRTGKIQFWAAGPGTATALRAFGIRKVRHPRSVGAREILEAFRNGVAQDVVYFRSNRAGPGLARALRQFGHRVTDVIVYRVASRPSLGAHARDTLLRSDMLLATSPSSLSTLRHALDDRTFDRLRRTARLVVLGERSRRAAQGHQFARISIAPSTTAQGFTRYLLRELRDAPA